MKRFLAQVDCRYFQSDLDFWLKNHTLVLTSENCFERRNSKRHQHCLLYDFTMRRNLSRITSNDYEMTISDFFVRLFSLLKKYEVSSFFGTFLHTKKFNLKKSWTFFFSRLFGARSASFSKKSHPKSPRLFFLPQRSFRS